MRDILGEVNDLSQRYNHAISSLGARTDELEQKMVRRGGDGTISSFSAMGGTGGSLGALVARDPRVQALISSPGKRGRVTIGVPSELAAITTVSVGGRDVLVPPDRAPGIVAPPPRRLTIRGLLMPGRTTATQSPM